VQIESSHYFVKNINK